VAPFVRTVVARTVDGPGGTERSVASVDDHFHGFTVRLDVRAGTVIDAEAGSHRHPWTTCPGALASVGRLRGPVTEVARTIVGTDRSHTCVHVNDLVWLAARTHEDRRYDVEVTPLGATLRRDRSPHLGWRFEGWVVTSPGPFGGLHVADGTWAGRLAEAGLDDDEREAARILRRAATVAIGYYDLDWPSYRVAADLGLGPMADSCHTFTRGRSDDARRLAAVPDPSLFGGAARTLSDGRTSGGATGAEGAADFGRPDPLR
jgi:hypothetical protein